MATMFNFNPSCFELLLVVFGLGIDNNNPKDIPPYFLLIVIGSKSYDWVPTTAPHVKTRENKGKCIPIIQSEGEIFRLFSNQETNSN